MRGTGDSSDLPCSGSAAAVKWAHPPRWASAWPAPRPSRKSTATAPPGGPGGATNALRSPPNELCQHKTTTSIFILHHFIWYFTCSCPSVGWKKLFIDHLFIFVLLQVNTLAYILCTEVVLLFHFLRAFHPENVA